MKHRHRKATLFALLLLGVTASALPASQAAGVPPKPAPFAKLGRPTPIIFHSPAAASLPPRLGNTMKPATATAKPPVSPTSAAVRSAQSRVGNSAIPASKPVAAPWTPPTEIETPAPTADDPNRARILALQEALTRIVHGGVLGRLRVGMRVLDLATGHVLFTRRGSVLMDPASNQKVLATATALLRLGSTWRFRTELSGPPPDGDGTIAT